MTKLLIDECLSPELALMARERGHHEASHVVWIGSAGWKDWELKCIILEQDWVLVSNPREGSILLPSGLESFEIVSSNQGVSREERIPPGEWGRSRHPKANEGRLVRILRRT